MATSTRAPWRGRGLWTASTWTSVAARLAPHTGRPDLRFTVTIEDTADENAHMHLAGNIYVERGMLALLSSEAELAAILGHEMGHASARHTLYSFMNERYAGDGRMSPTDYAVNLDHQLQADRLGLAYLRAAGYAPRAMLQMLRATARASSAHFEAAEDLSPRLAHVARHGADVDGGEEGRDRYLDHIDGLRYRRQTKGYEPLWIRVRRTKLGGRFDLVMTALCNRFRWVTWHAILNGVEWESYVEPATRLKCIEP